MRRSYTRTARQARVLARAANHPAPPPIDRALRTQALPDPTPGGALPTDPFERTVQVGLQLAGERGLEDIDVVLMIARGGDPVILATRREEVITQVQRRHAALMSA